LLEIKLLFPKGALFDHKISKRDQDIESILISEPIAKLSIIAI